MPPASHPAAPHANACVHIRLSPWAPDCIDLPWADPRLSRAYWSTPLVKVVASLLRRLGRAPDEITLEERGDFDIAFIGPAPPEHDPHGDRAGILALLWGGPDEAPVNIDQVRAELDRLAASGWKPAAWSPPRKPGQVITFPQTPTSTPSKEGVPA